MLRDEDFTPAIESALQQIDGRSQSRRRAAARADPRVRATDPRHRRRGHGRDGGGQQRRLPRWRRGRPLRPPSQVRRAAARHRRAHRRRGSRRGGAPHAVGVAAGAWRAIAPLARRHAPGGGRDGCSPTSVRPAHSSRCEPPTGEVLAAASGPGGEGLSTATVGQYAPGSTMKVVSSLALLRAGLSPEQSSRLSGERPSSMASPSRTTTTTRRPGSAGSTSPEPLPTRATPPSSVSGIGSLRGSWPKRPQSLGLGVDYDLGYPVYPRLRPAPGGVGDRPCSLDDRSGPGARVADRDGGCRRVSGRWSHGGPVPGACRSSRLGRRRPSPPARHDCCVG